MSATPKVAFIVEADCIGCARCLPVCPTDAIVGAPHFLHTVIADDCTGCKRCLPVCPTDCIRLVPRPANVPAPTEMAARWRRLYRAHRARLARASAADSHALTAQAQSFDIAAAVARARTRRHPTTGTPRT
ncbi:MAG: RnfABCDGE type electron transport complex subunit B [Nevskia sp.]|nr:RnfABCDGE type electron transport complex subunit B [Nevskia sp.]